MFNASHAQCKAFPLARNVDASSSVTGLAFSKHPAAFLRSACGVAMSTSWRAKFLFQFSYITREDKLDLFDGAHYSEARSQRVAFLRWELLLWWMEFSWLFDRLSPVTERKHSSFDWSLYRTRAEHDRQICSTCSDMLITLYHYSKPVSDSPAVSSLARRQISLKL